MKHIITYILITISIASLPLKKQDGGEVIILIEEIFAVQPVDPNDDIIVDNPTTSRYTVTMSNDNGENLSYEVNSKATLFIAADADYEWTQLEYEMIQ